MTDTCVSCGAIIPEGRMVCPSCENGFTPSSAPGVITLLDARDWAALETAMRRQETLAIIHDFPGRGITVTASVEKAPEVWGCPMIVGILVDGPGKTRRQRQRFQSVEEAKNIMKTRDLKAEALKQGLNMAALADAIGIHDSSLYRKLRGEVDFQLWELKKIRKVLNLSKGQMWDIFFND